MRVFSHPHFLALYESDNRAWFFDARGRNFGAWDEGWWITHGLSGKCVARRWQSGVREVKALAFGRAEELKSKALAAIQQAGDDIPQAWRESIATFDGRADRVQFRATYKPVGILPPDQYECAVVQITESCGWNRCLFCSFYKSQPFRIRTVADVERHAEAVKTFLGQGLRRRRSIFLGEANALAMKTGDLVDVMTTLDRILVPDMPDFRGYFSFIEPAGSATKTVEDFERLRSAGLRRLYWGIETGDPKLRKALGKPGTMADATASVLNAKQAGILTGLIFLIGAGGRRYRESHRRHSLTWIQSLPLGDSDIVFLSPLRGRDGVGRTPLSRRDMDAEVLLWKQALSPKVRVAPYDIREFVY